MSNHLASASSPYLLQHADNPVDWYPWEEAALEKARAEDRPIFLSIGYSACHWCHVMAHESFEDEQVAAILNEHFVSIKVDREERPDLDSIYMNAVQTLTGRGGWPMSVFLTPQGVPFYGGTYFPSTARYGMPAFRDVVVAVANAWRDRREEVLQSGQGVVAAIERQSLAPEGRAEILDSDTLRAAFEDLRQSFDAVHGGWGGGPKFPQPMALEFLLRYHYGSGPPAALQMVRQTLTAMARGGIYDQLGGGFHRYSVDDHWLVPHFEKMLYDNAQLARVYLHAWEAIGDPLYRSVCEEILDYVIREMTAPNGGFYSTQDADSEGEEGKFFIWTPDEIRQVLREEADAFIGAYGVTTAGNFEGRSILVFSADTEARPALAAARLRLFEARERRAHPGRDEKVLTAWNGLMLAAFAEAARVLGRHDYRLIGERNARFLLQNLRGDDGRLWRSWSSGKARLNAYLEDYACLIEGLLELYQTTFESRWYVAAQELAETMIQRFRAPDSGFYDTSDDHENLIVRPRDLHDNATPSGNAMAVWVSMRLAGLAVEPRYDDLARDSLRRVQPLLGSYPLAFGQWLVALDYALACPREIAIVGDPGAVDTQALLQACTGGYRPHQILALGAPEPKLSAIPLLRARDAVDGHAAAYVCTGSTCYAPVTDPEALSGLIG